MQDQQPPVIPELLEPELTPIEFEDRPPMKPGLLTIAAPYRNQTDQEFLVIAVAEEHHRDDLDEYREGRRVWFQAMAAADVQSELAPRKREGVPSGGLEVLLTRSQSEQEEEVTGAVAIDVTLERHPAVDEGTEAIIFGRIDPDIREGGLHCYDGPDYVSVSADNRVRLGGLAGNSLLIPPTRTGEYANNSCWIYGVRRSTYSINLRRWHRV